MNFKLICIALLIALPLFAQTISESGGVISFGGQVNFEASAGARLGNTLTKIYGAYHDYQTTARLDTVRIRFMGDSICDGSSATSGHSYFEKTKAYLETQFPDVNFDIQNMSYGGYCVNHYFLYLDDAIIHPDIDLFVFAEYDLTEDYRNVAGIRKIVERVRRLTTADIILVIPNPDSSYTEFPGEMTDFYRNTANEYGCELVDIYTAFKDTVASGVKKSLLYADASHPNNRGHNIYYQEIAKRFSQSAYDNLRLSPGHSQEYIVEFSEPVLWRDSTRIRPYGAWVASTPSFNLPPTLANGTNSDSVQVTFTGTGFDLYTYGTAGAGTFALRVDHVLPSVVRVNSRPLSYATVPTWDAANKNPDRDHRPLKAFVIDTCATGQYTITITDSATHAYTLTSPTTEVIGTGDYTADFTDALSNIVIPGNAAGYWIGAPSTGDKYYFTVWNNWVDTVATSASNAVKCFSVRGLQYGQHTLSIIKTNASTTYLSAIRIYKPEAPCAN